MAKELESKAQLVREICSISTLFASCSHIRPKTRSAIFIDWYLILKVDEDSGMDVIRRRYRQLALQLHPDKNSHPKAEVAFKLISEAYECLSDKARRRAFNSERQNKFCKECHRKLQQSNSRKNHKDASQAKPYRILQALKDVQNRLKEESRVIESCLRANESAGNESPLFDPSDRLLFPEYPHHRAAGVEKHRREAYWYFGNFLKQWGDRSVRRESPVYQLRSESKASWSKSSGFRS